MINFGQPLSATWKKQVLDICWKSRLLSLLLMGIEGGMSACHSLLLQVICLQLLYCEGFLLPVTWIPFNFAAPAF